MLVQYRAGHIRPRSHLPARRSLAYRFRTAAWLTCRRPELAVYSRYEGCSRTLDTPSRPSATISLAVSHGQRIIDLLADQPPLNHCSLEGHSIRDARTTTIHPAVADGEAKSRSPRL